MRSARFLITLATAATVSGVIVSPGAPATGSLPGNVCKMLQAKQVLAVHVTTNCTQQKTAKTPEGTVMTAVWGINRPAGPRLSVGIEVPANAAFFSLLKTAHIQGKSVGIGDWSREDGLGNGKTADGISFTKGKYFVAISLNTKPDKPLQTSAPLIALAKSVAGQL